jgi:gamma-glutamyltranspeptidase/glutathione hydrolase
MLSTRPWQWGLHAPQWYGIGGEVAILVYSAKEKKVWSISGQGPAPAEATIAWFRKQGLDAIPSVGLLPATVPAATAAWLVLLERFGRLSLTDAVRRLNLLSRATRPIPDVGSSEQH